MTTALPRWWIALCLLALAPACSDESPATAAPNDAATTADTRITADAGSEDAATTDDTGLAPDDSGSAAGDTGPCTSCAELVGKVSRKAGTKPTAGGKGNLYIAVFEGNPITDQKNAKLVARTLIENVDLNADTTMIPYRVPGIPTSPTERQIVAFLDDNGTTTAANPAPDKGDLVTIEITSFSGVKIKLETAGEHVKDLQLNAAIP